VFVILSEHLPACPSAYHPVWTSANLSICLLSCLNICQPVQVFSILSVCLPACLSICYPVITSASLSDEHLPACLNIYPGCERLLSRMSASISERPPNVRQSFNTSYMSGIHSKRWTAFLNVCCLSEPLLVFWISYPMLFIGGKNKCCWSGSVCFEPPGSGSVIICSDSDLPSTSQKSKKPLDWYFFNPFFDFLSLKNDVNVPSKNST
jgi:hypothetical protein